MNKKSDNTGPSNANNEDRAERLQKVMANAGLGSRRALEKDIEAGRVSVNGQTAILGTRASIDDKIEFMEHQWQKK